MNGEAMRTTFSNRLNEDIVRTLEFAIRDFGIVNISVLGEQIRKRNQLENVALEDIVEKLAERALLKGAAIEFDSATLEHYEDNLRALS
jgi:hypothetical protein